MHSSLSYWGSVCILALLVLLSSPMHAQQIPPEVARHGYADTLLVNGKVVSMDDKSTSSSVGRVYQAIAVKGDTIIKLGSSGEIRALAGPDTRILDLKGRTLMPGMINCHEHPLMYADDYQSAHLHASSAYKALKGLA